MRIFSALLLAAVLVPTAARAATGDAPADEYFGPLHMSALQIRMSIGALGRRYHDRTISDHDLIHDAALGEAALRVWRNKYPKDTWLAPTAYHMEQLYHAVQSDEAHKHATSLLKYIAQFWPATSYGHLARGRLAAGFPALAPESVVVATPAPQPIVTVAPSGVADAATAAASAVPTAAAVPQPPPNNAMSPPAAATPPPAPASPAPVVKQHR